MASKSKTDAVALSRRYSTALRKHLASSARTGLRPAAGLGRDTLLAGLGALDLVRFHERALIALLPADSSTGKRDRLIKRAGRFLVAALTPIDNAHRAAIEANRDSAASQEELEREITLREAAVEECRLANDELAARSQRMQLHLRRLSHEILSSQEEERKRISRELHDRIGQSLTAINVRLATLKQAATVNSVSMKTIASTQRLLEQSLNTVHQFARELRPALLDDLGLIPALHSYMTDFTKRTRIPIRFNAEVAVEKLEGDKRTALYRVAVEALTNIDKHSKANLVNVTLKKRQGVVLMEVHDNGKSFKVSRILKAEKIGRLGLLGMRERVEMVGGEFTVESTAGGGTTVRARIPLGAVKQRSPGESNR